MRKLKDKGRIGIFGGSFDPIHIGHLRFAEISREIFSLEKIIFIPAYRLPHTYKHGASDYYFRYEITKKSIKENKYFEISDIESKREKESYTIDTLKIFKKRFPEKELFFLMGSDSFEKIETWKEWQTLLTEFNHIIAVRPGYEEQKIYKLLKSYGLEYKVIDTIKKENNYKKSNINILVDKSLIEISSTEIKDFIKQNKSVRYLVDETILEDIIKYYKEV